MTDDSAPPEDLRERVVQALEAAGFRNREDHLPMRKAGGTFSAVGSDRSGINVTADWWDATLPELEELRRGLAKALTAAGFLVLQMGPERFYVPPDTGQSVIP